MKMKPTNEQEAVIDAFAARESLVVDAVAGAGKTATLRMAAQSAPTRSCLYVAFTKDLAKEAKGSMPGNVEARTAHSLAFEVFGRPLKHRIGGKRVTAYEAAKIMYNSGSIPATHILNQGGTIGDVLLRPATLASLALKTVKRFCQSADAEISPWHVPKVDGIEAQGRDELVRVVLPIARLAWIDLTHPAGKLRFEQDVYVKLWALSKPTIPADAILFDEAQDANPVLAEVLKAQSAQLVAVGDPCQQMYEWRGSVDAMADWPADKRLTLSQSFRFGQRVADRANLWLALLGTATRVVGAPWLDSTVGPIDEPDAVLCRTNAGAVAAAITHLGTGARVHIVGGGREMQRMAEAADRLMHGEPAEHPELAAFTTWDEVRAYAAEDDGADLVATVKLIDEHGPDKILKIVRLLTARSEDASVVVSTGHKAKGLQWPRVVIGDDYREPQPVPYPTLTSPTKALVLRRGELMGAYVAVTRAEQRLDDSGLAWVHRVHEHGVPVVVAGEARPAPPPPVVPRRHDPAAIMPDAPDDAAPDIGDSPPPVLHQQARADVDLSPDCHRCGVHHTGCACVLMPDRRRTADLARQDAARQLRAAGLTGRELHEALALMAAETSAHLTPAEVGRG